MKNENIVTATFKFLNGRLFPANEEIPIISWKFRKEFSNLGGNCVVTGYTLLLTICEDYAGKIQSCVNKLYGSEYYVPKLSIADEMIVRNIQDSSIDNFHNVFPISYNFDTNTLELHADWIN